MRSGGIAICDRNLLRCSTLDPVYKNSLARIANRKPLLLALGFRFALLFLLAFLFPLVFFQWLHRLRSSDPPAALSAPDSTDEGPLLGRMVLCRWMSDIHGQALDRKTVTTALE